MNMVFARIGTNLDLQGATLAYLNLSGASITQDLRLAVESHRPIVWRTKEGAPGDLFLRHRRVGNLMDAEEVWPEKGHLYLDGFILSHFGGFMEDKGPEARKRGATWWDQLARRDTKYSPSPYRQLAAAFDSVGERGLADEIRYLGHVREQEELKGTDCVWSWPLRLIAGFGVYPHRVLYWIAVVSLAGAVYLWTCAKGVRDAGHSFIWCFGASLARLLPVVEINKEFKDFFDDPKRERLPGFQMSVFSFIGVLGWFLAAILVAAVSGMTGKS